MGTPWPDLPSGTALMVVKLDPNGAEVATYLGVVIDAGAPAPWVVVQAEWVNREYNLDGLLFITGDTLHEFFSPDDCFNVFSIFSSEGQLRGWYANVTHPTRLDTSTDPITLFWHDLYIDVIALPNGPVVVRDEDELDASGLRERDPDLYHHIFSVRDEVVDRARTRTFPFHESDIEATTPNQG
jgi:predicted RNA-binding protein associated with RNAse of E/G family